MNESSYEASYDGDSLRELFENCCNLEKVFVGHLYSLDDTDIVPLLDCKKIKQLDISRSDVSWELVNLIFPSLPELRLLDLSDCEKIKKSHVRKWRRLYPRVSIKFYSELLSVFPLE